MATIDRLHELILPIVTTAEADLYDLELAGNVLRVTLDRSGGIDIDTISSVTRSISHMLDEVDPIAGEFTLEVSSPGLERPLRTPTHFERAVGEQVTLKLRAGVEGDRRIKGTLTGAGPADITVTPEGSGPAPEPVRIAHEDIERARTTFEWGPAPKPGGGSRRGPSPTSTKKKSTKADSSTNKKAAKS